MMRVNDILEMIINGGVPTKKELSELIETFRRGGDIAAEIYERARGVAEALRDEHYGRRVFLRGLIEFTSYCKNNCYYCGLRRDNKNAERYRLTEEQILECCDYGASLGFNTFVLQGGEDGHFTDEKLVSIVSKIKAAHPKAAVTLSVGERSYDSYKALRAAGADRFLLRHESATDEHYAKLHPESLTLENRKRCLYDLKSLGYQVGAGFMVGSPYQTSENLAADLLFLRELQPQMVGIGPFIPHRDTPFRDYTAGGLELVLFMLALTRILLPKVLLPATTALGTIANDGRERGVLAGANVVMPNLSPIDVRKKYLLYNDKLCSGDETAEHIKELAERFSKINCVLDMSRGDSKNI